MSDGFSPIDHNTNQYPHSPGPSFVQPTIPSSDDPDPYGSGSIIHDPYGSGSIRQQPYGSGAESYPYGSGSLGHQPSSAEVNTIRQSGSYRASPTSPKQSFLQPTIHGTDAGSMLSPRPDMRRLSVLSDSKSHSSNGSRSPLESLIDEGIEHLRQHFIMHTKKNMLWKPNGPKDVSSFILGHVNDHHPLIMLAIKSRT